LRTKSILLTAFTAIGVAYTTVALAATTTVNDIKITEVYVNGGADVKKPGTTCIKLSAGAPAAFSSGFIAIPNNNADLLSAAMTAKVSKGNAQFGVDSYIAPVLKNAYCY
jgi:uncharacterized membrane-anchored protein